MSTSGPDDVSALRARIAELERQLAAASAPAPGDVAAAPSRQPARAALSAVCLVLACVLAPLAVTASWMEDTLVDTDGYVDTVAPIADQPAVQQALADEVTAAVVENLELQRVTSDALTALSRVEDVPPRVAAVLPALSVPLASGIEGFTRTQVERVLASPEFAAVWSDVNRTAHDQVVQLLKGEQDGAVTAQGDTVTLNLGPVIAQVRERMVDRGFSLASRIPTVDRSFTLVESDAVSRAQVAYRLLDLLGTWLAVVSVAFLIAGIALARDRWRALARGALGVTAAMILLGAALAVARTAYVTTTPADVLTPEAAEDVFDLLVRSLRGTLRTVAVLGLVVAAAAYLSGGSPRAISARAALGRGIAGVRRSGTEATGWDTGRLGVWLALHRSAWRVAVVALGAAVLLAWPAPSGWVVLWLAVAVVVALGVLQLLMDPTVAPPAGRPERLETEVGRPATGPLDPIPPVPASVSGSSVPGDPPAPSAGRE